MFLAPEAGLKPPFVGVMYKPQAAQKCHAPLRHGGKRV
jgi:hypothetical protein